MKRRFEDLLMEIKQGDYCYAISLKSEFHMVSPTLFIRKMHEMLSEKGIEDRLIAPVKMKTSIKKTFQGIKKIKIRYTDIENTISLILVPGRVFNNIWGNRPTAIEIVSDQIHEQYKNFFLELWKKSS